VLADGENVIGVATEKYGAPSAWRAVAQANGIDDPLRVHPGQVLHLPGPSELTEGDRP
jgi:nucleoid-associated protein YgaU